MGKEIERKFLLNRMEWGKTSKPVGEHFKQGYLLTAPEKTIRIRTTATKGWLTIKGISVGASRLEYEYEIPLSEAAELLENFSTSALEKIRYKITFEGNIWEIDEFLGDNFGLIVAEIELLSEDQVFGIPGWISEEVTGVQKYYNSNLTLNPFKDWVGKK